MRYVAVDYKSALSERYVIDILSLIYEKGQIMASDLIRICSNYRTMRAKVDMLIDLGLVEQHVERGNRLRIIYTISEEGREVAELISLSRARFDAVTASRGGSVQEGLSAAACQPFSSYRHG